jgi:hypothetical protein
VSVGETGKLNPLTAIYSSQLIAAREIVDLVIEGTLADLGYVILAQAGPYQTEPKEPVVRVAENMPDIATVPYGQVESAIAAKQATMGRGKPLKRVHVLDNIVADDNIKTPARETFPVAPVDAEIDINP